MKTKSKSKKRSRPRYSDSLAVTHPNLVKELHPHLNGNLKPTMVSAGSDEKVFWLGKDCGHIWTARIFSRTSPTKPSGCAVCVGKQIMQGVNDVATLNPEMLEWWVEAVDDVDITLSDVSKNSTVLGRWKCPDCAYVFEQSVYDFQRKKRKCRKCSGGSYGAVQPGVNDLASQKPEIAREWDRESNQDRTPENTSVSSAFNAWWVCPVDESHRWQAKVYSRTRDRSASCPTCAAGQSRSRGESEVERILKLLGLSFQTSVRNLVPGELDIYIPDSRVAIEFNGLYWHSEANGKDRKYHAKKTQECEDVGIQLIHIWEDEWRHQRDFVVRSIAHATGTTDRLGKMGVIITPDPSLARTYNVDDLQENEVSAKEAALFLESHHVAGDVTPSRYFGLRDKNQALRAVLAVSSTKDASVWRVRRYATRGNVPGGLNALLSVAQEGISEDISQWVATSERSTVDVEGFADAGFAIQSVTRPDYQYVVKGRRESRQRYPISVFKKSDELIYHPGMSIEGLMKVNSMPRIWDAGKVRWVKSAIENN